MSRARLVALAVGAGLLLGAVPARAAVDPEGPAGLPSEGEALALLQAAADAGHDLSWSGTQRVATWGDAAWSTTAAVHHDPASGVVVDADRPLAATSALDRRQLAVLAASYDLRVAGPGRCTGRTAALVEAARPDGTVAGRFWVDRSSGLLLRREVFDEAGARVRRSELVRLAVDARPGTAPVPVRARATGERVDPDALRAAGWPVPARLPGGLRLLDARRDGAVVHLAYTDGLSTVSLFAQVGELGSGPGEGFTPETVAGRPVWVQAAAAQRVVWGGQGRVWTLVSDAAPGAVRAAVAALPGDAAPDDGLRDRLGRGLQRLGSLLNPFA